MTKVTAKLIDEALRLDPIERANLIEELLSSLDMPDVELNAKWDREARDRLNGYKAGASEAYSAEDVLTEFDGT